MKDWRLNPPSQGGSISDERPQPAAYHVYLDDDDEFRESLSIGESQDDERCLPELPEHVFSVEMPSAFVATESGFRALPRRKQMAIVAASVVAVTMMAAIAFGGNALPDVGDESDSDIAPVKGLDATVASVLRLSVSPRRSSVGQEEPSASTATTATIVHFSETGNVEMEASQHQGSTYIAGEMARITALRPGSKDGMLSFCAPIKHIPGAKAFVRMLSSARGNLAAWVRSVGKSIEATEAHADCSGELWHLYSHDEDALICLKEDQILEINTEKTTVSVLSHVSGHVGSPIEGETCEAPSKTEKLSQVGPFSKEEMWAGYSDDTAWFNIKKLGNPDSKDVTLLPPDDDDDDEGLVDNLLKPKKDCVFIHGVGHTPDPGSASILNGSLPYYWGKVQEHTQQCASWAFLNVDTVYRGWDNKSLQEEVCKSATWDPVTGKSSLGAIKNRIVFTHSMGNMMLAGAIDSGLCSLDNETSTWYEVSGPMLGSKMASKLQDICDNQGLYKWVVTKMGFCLPDGGTTPAYQSLEPNYPGLQRIAKTIASRISGAMCGTSAYGLTSIYSAEMLALAELADFVDVNDGVVSWSSCNQQGGNVPYKPDYRSAWYAASANHIDTECYEGDGDWGDARKPCSWYSLRE